MRTFISAFLLLFLICSALGSTKNNKNTTTLIGNRTLFGDINQRGTRPEDKPIPLANLSDEAKSIIRKYLNKCHINKL